ncbi:hypothetical protein F5883DRAFT_127510 [Diaporthe sp. PMI_573]|nr:hypothetical protein F5883DRAFT_127510 [Diaporthaceae sp. PMI_573]
MLTNDNKQVTTMDQSVLPARLHRTPRPHYFNATRSIEARPPGADVHAPTPQTLLLTPSRPASTPQASPLQTSMSGELPPQDPTPLADMHKKDYITSAPSKPALQGKPSNPNPEPSCSARPPRPPSIPDEPMGNARQRTPASATQSRQNVKRRTVELPAESTMVVPKRRRMEGSAAVVQQTSAAESSAEQQHSTSSRPDLAQEKATHRVVTFEEVYQQGEAKFKHKIFEYKEGSGNWYIVKCDKHEMHFGLGNPLHGAAKHLHSPQHGRLEKTHHLAIQNCGFLVKDCTAELANLNNTVFEEALKNGYKILKPTNKTSNQSVAAELSNLSNDGNSQQQNFRKAQAKPRDMERQVAAAQPEPHSDLSDKRGHYLIANLGSNQDEPDCIVIPSGSASHSNKEDTSGNESEDQELRATGRPSAHDHDSSASSTGQSSTRKQDANPVVSAAAFDQQLLRSENAVERARI